MGFVGVIDQNSVKMLVMASLYTSMFSVVHENHVFKKVFLHTANRFGMHRKLQKTYPSFSEQKLFKFVNSILEIISTNIVRAILDGTKKSFFEG